MVPPPLVLGLLLHIGFALLQLLAGLAGARVFEGIWDLLGWGFQASASVLIAVGAFQLARRVSEPARFGARLVGVAHIAAIGMLGFWLLISIALEHDQAIFDAFTLGRYLTSFVALGAAVGFGLVSNGVGLQLGLPVLAFIGVPMPFMTRWLFHDVGSLDAAYIFEFVPAVILAALSLAAVMSRRGEIAPAPVTTSSEAAFGLAARALWLRVLAACSLVGLTLIATIGGGERGMTDSFKLVSFLAPLLDAGALAVFAAAGLRLARGDRAPWLASASAAATLIACGSLLCYVPRMYDLLYGHQGFADDEAAYAASAFGQLVPLIAATGVTLLLAAVVRLARLRQRDRLRTYVARSSALYVGLMLGALVLMHYGAATPSRAGITLVAMVALAAMTLGALSIAARAFGRGVELLANEPIRLPEATLLKGGDR